MHTDLFTQYLHEERAAQLRAEADRDRLARAVRALPQRPRWPRWLRPARLTSRHRRPAM